MIGRSPLFVSRLAAAMPAAPYVCSNSENHSRELRNEAWVNTTVQFVDTKKLHTAPMITTLLFEKQLEASFIIQHEVKRRLPHPMCVDLAFNMT
jgi:hypothetical protein